MPQLQPTLVFTRKAGEPFGEMPVAVSKVIDGSKPDAVRIVFSPSGRPYTYKRENVAVMSLTQIVDPARALIRRKNGILKNVRLCGLYTSNNPEKESGYLIQFENGKAQFLAAEDVAVHLSGSDSFLMYLREVCNQTEKDIPYPDGRSGKYLRDQMTRSAHLRQRPQPASSIATPRPSGGSTTAFP